MEEVNLFREFSNLGLAGMLFYMWWMNSRKETALQGVIKEQVEDKRRLREERTELVSLLKDHAALNSRIADLLSRVERTLLSRV